MKRTILILFIAWCLTGCKNQTPTVDPFFGRTTVPPPPTGSIAGQNAAPYYTPPTQPPYAQATTPYSPGNATQYPGAAPSALTGPSTTAPSGSSTYPVRSMPQNNPALGQPPSGYIPQTTPAQPASMPVTPPGTNLPSGNRYTPPGGSFNYRGASTAIPNLQPTSTSPNRVATPYYAGGAPNRTPMPATNNGPRPIDDSQGGNYLLPASRQYSIPTPVQPQNNSPQPTWREASSSDTRLIDDNIEPVSNTETKDTSE